MPVIVYKFGMPSEESTRGEPLPDVVGKQLFLAHQLREELVELEYWIEGQRKTVWSTFPEIETVEAQIAQREERAEALVSEIQKAKAAQRTKTPKTPARDTLKQLRAEIRQLKADRRSFITVARESAKPMLSELMDRYRAQIKSYYRKFVQEDGLYWAVFNDVVDHHRVAVRRVAALRAQGQPAQLRHHRWDGSGALAVQLQRGEGQPARTPELLASGEGPWANVLQLRPWIPPEEFGALTRSQRNHRARGTVRIRVGGEPIQLKVIVHRMFPADADIVAARLVVGRVGSTRRVSLHVSARMPEAPAHDPAKPVIALHGGWRKEPDGSIRVATWRSSSPVEIPDHLVGNGLGQTDLSGNPEWRTGAWPVVRRISETSGYIVLPAPWLAGLERPDHLRARRDHLVNREKARLIKFLEKHPQDDLKASDVAKWRSPLRLAKLALKWKENPPEGGKAVAAALESWRVYDQTVWDKQEHGRRKQMGRRNDAWRKVVRWLVDTASEIVVEDTNYAALIKSLSKEEEGLQLPEEVRARAARQRVLVSPGLLRETLVSTATRRAVKVATVSSAFLSREHTCGHVSDAPLTTTGHKATCPGCGRNYDTDLSATVLMLRRASELETVDA